MLNRCTYMATVGIKGLMTLTMLCFLCWSTLETACCDATAELDMQRRERLSATECLLDLLVARFLARITN